VRTRGAVLGEEEANGDDGDHDRQSTDDAHHDQPLTAVLRLHLKTPR
jgi:hypothetical protein